MNTMAIYQLPFRQAFLIFIMFSVTGWISEVLYVGIFHEHKFVNRGFLHGPLCPVYGFGGVVLCCCRRPFTQPGCPSFLLL